MEKKKKLPNDEFFYRIELPSKLQLNYPKSNPLNGLLSVTCSPSDGQVEAAKSYDGDQITLLYDIDGHTIWIIHSDTKFSKFNPLPF